MIGIIVTTVGIATFIWCVAILYIERGRQYER